MTAREELHEALLSGAQHWMAAGEDPAEADRLIEAYAHELRTAGRLPPPLPPPHGDTNPRECPHAVEVTTWSDLSRKYVCGCPLDEWPVSLEK